MASTHIAFLATRSDARGLLHEKTLAPLPMVGAVIEVQTQWYYARATVKMEFANTAPSVAKTFLALDTPYRVGGVLASVRVEAEQHFLQSKVTEIPADPRAALSSNSERVATIDVPWLLHAGQSVLVTAVFFLPLSIVNANGTLLKLPKELIPKRPAAKPEDEDSAPGAQTSWSSRFQVTATHRVPATVLVHGRGVLFAAVDGSAKANISGAAVSKMGDPRRFEVRYENRDVIDQLPNDFEIIANMIPDEDQLVVQAVREDAPFVHDTQRVALAISCTPVFGAAGVAAKDKAAIAAAAAAAALKPNVELSILVDCSNSMAPHINSARAAVAELVSSLPSSVFVNVARFGDNIEWALRESVQLTQDASDTLLAFPLHADMGHTRLYHAVGEAYLRPVVEGHCRIVLIVTDGGEIRHTTRLVELVAANVHTTRVAVVSVGASCHTQLFDKLAEVSEGVHVHSTSIESDLTKAVAGAVQPLFVPTLCGTTVEFTYDGVEERPPVRLTVDHPRMIFAGSRRIMYAFGAKTMRGCTVKVSGLVGSEYREIRAFTGAADKFDVNSSNEADIATVSLVHAAAAASRIDTLINLNAKAALSVEEKEEATRLSLAFSIPTPFARLRCRANDAPAATFDPTGKLVWAPFVERRSTYELIAPPPPTKGIDGRAVDPDEVALPTTQPDSREAQTATDFLRTVVVDAVERVTAPATPFHLVTAQRRAGYWPYAASYLALDFMGVTAAKVRSTMPAELKATQPPTPPVATSPVPPPAAAATPATPAPTTAPNSTPAAAPAAANPAVVPKAPTPTNEPPAAAPAAAAVAAPAVVPTATVDVLDVWTTALVVAWFERHPEWKTHPRTRWTALRAAAYIAGAGPVAAKALEKAKLAQL